MLLELIATIVVGLGVGGVMLLLNKATRGRLPRFLTPALAGLSMISFTIWSEYSWAGRTAGALPQGVEIAWKNADEVFYRPWTYLFPQTNRMLAVDVAGARTHDEQPGQRMVDLYLMGRWAPNRRVTVVIDCDAGRRADLLGDAEIAPDGTVRNTNWVEVRSNDPVFETACERKTG